MKFLAIAAGLLLLSASAEGAGLPADDLRQIGVTTPAGAQFPIDSQWKNESGTSVSIRQSMAGRPTLVVFADYTCSSLCGPILSFVSEGLASSGLSPQEYQLVVLGIDPKDGPREAAIMKRERIADDAVASAAVLLTADEATIRSTARAVDYRYAYDAARDQFAHPAAIFVLTRDGYVARVLSGLGISGNDFRLALVEAGQGRIGTFADRIRLLCYAFDPSIGVYTSSIYRALALASAFNIALLAAGIGWLSLRRAREG